MGRRWAHGIMPDMRFQTIIVPGWKNSGPDHWQTEWEQALPHCRRVDQRDWAHPAPRDWHGCVAHAVDAATSPVLLVAHSLGCLSVAALPVALHARVAGALLVAPADVERPGANADLKAFAPVALHPLAFQTVVVASDNDPYCTLTRADQFAQAWGSRLIVVPGAGHINADSGYGKWPQGLKLLTALRRRAAWRIQPPSPKVAPLSAHLPSRLN